MYYNCTVLYSTVVVWLSLVLVLTMVIVTSLGRLYCFLLTSIWTPSRQPIVRVTSFTPTTRHSRSSFSLPPAPARCLINRLHPLAPPSTIILPVHLSSFAAAGDVCLSASGEKISLKKCFDSSGPQWAASNVCSADYCDGWSRASVSLSVTWAGCAKRLNGSTSCLEWRLAGNLETR